MRRASQVYATTDGAQIITARLESCTQCAGGSCLDLQYACNRYNRATPAELLQFACFPRHDNIKYFQTKHLQSRESNDATNTVHHEVDDAVRAADDDVSHADPGTQPVEEHVEKAGKQSRSRLPAGEVVVLFSDSIDL